MATILVVDDEPDIRLLVKFALADQYEVVEAANGREALEVVAERHPDLVVLDVMMPELSGWDTLELLKADRDPDVREIPVVMLTALTTAMDRAKGGIEGAVHYLAKPIAPDDLLSTVSSALEGEPEPVQRRRAQQRALEDLARLERGEAGGTAGAVSGPRTRLTGLESSRPSDLKRTPGASGPPPAPDLRRRAEELTDKQRELLAAIRRAPTVLAAAADLGMSRSNVYASLRRIARRLEVTSVADLLDRVRAGHVIDS